MKRLLIIFVCSVLSLAFSSKILAHQMFEGSADWEDNERTLVMGKWSQLYYELNVGWNISHTGSYGDNQANFLYFALGVGAPVNTENAWRKFLPQQKIPDNEEEAELFGSMDTKDVYGGKLGLGWIHYFNHAIGMYSQLSWGFLADFGSPDDSTSTTSTDSSSKKTFIYNTVPIEVGICFNMWGHLHVQGGVTYMWKEIPLLTIGIGATF